MHEPINHNTHHHHHHHVKLNSYIHHFHTLHLQVLSIHFISLFSTYGYSRSVLIIYNHLCAIGSTVYAELCVWICVCVGQRDVSWSDPEINVVGHSAPLR